MFSINLELSIRKVILPGSKYPIQITQRILDSVQRVSFGELENTTPNYIGSMAPHGLQREESLLSQLLWAQIKCSQFKMITLWNSSARPNNLGPQGWERLMILQLEQKTLSSWYQMLNKHLSAAPLTNLITNNNGFPLRIPLHLQHI